MMNFEARRAVTMIGIGAATFLGASACSLEINSTPRAESTQGTPHIKEITGSGFHKTFAGYNGKGQGTFDVDNNGTGMISLSAEGEGVKMTDIHCRNDRLTANLQDTARSNDTALPITITEPNSYLENGAEKICVDNQLNPNADPLAVMAVALLFTKKY